MELLYTRRYKTNRLISFVLSFLLGIIAAGILSNLSYENKIDYKMRSLAGVAVFLFLNLILTRKFRRRKAVIYTPYPEYWEKIFKEYVPYFNNLTKDDQYYFIKKVQIFLDEVMITGVNMQVDEVTKVLVGAAAIIPVFKIPDWDYSFVTDVFVCPDNLHENIELLHDKDDVLGLVVYNKSSIYFSRDTLIKNFKTLDGHNIGIHEFIHKIDEKSGDIDGILPSPFLSKKDRNLWFEIIDFEMEKIRKKESDFREYALTSRSEFIAVASEYFFERPVEMEEKHTALYHMIKKIFRQNLASTFGNENLPGDDDIE